MKTKLLLLIAFFGFGLASGQNNPAFSISNASVVEGGSLTFAVTLANVCNVDTVMLFSTTTGTANSSDFNVAQISIAIPAGQTTSTVSVITIQDAIFEPTETFSLVGSITSGCNANANSTNTATGTIIDNDSLPTVTISNTTVQEGNAAIFTITLSNPASTPVVISVVTTNGTAAGNDFTPITTPTVITIPAGQTTASISTPTLIDAIAEGNEIFTLSGTVTSGNTTNTNPSGTGTIIDNSDINATDDFMSVGSGQVGGFVGSVLFNDTLNGTPATTANTEVAPSIQGPLSIDSNGNITIVPNTPAGTYILTYTLCQANTLPSNCDTANVVVTVISNASISLSATGTYNDYNNDGFTNVGDVINYQYTVTNTGQQVLSNVQVFYNQSPVSGGPLATLGIGASDSTTFTETYVLTQANINAGIVFSSGYVLAYFNEEPIANDFGLQTSLSISNGIKFNLFFDTNGNGIQNAGEQNYSGGNFTYQLNNSVVHSVLSQNGMFTLYESNPANIYNLGCSLGTNNNFCNGQYSLVTSSYANISVANGSGITTYNFPVISATCSDLSVNLYQYGAPPRPGFTYMNQIKYTNNGNQAIASGTVTFTRNTTVSAVSTFPATTATATGFTYNFTNLFPNESRYIDVTMQVPVIPTVSLGQLLTNSVSVSLPPNDNNPVNNSDTLTQVIVGSYDPNDKTESHGGRILLSSFTANDYLTYKIQFENTGTAEAINIRVNDVLDAKLNPNIIRMVSASHPYVLDRVGNTLNWKFDGVNLPPSVANTQIGHGFIIFQIKPTSGFAVGDVIPNLANIYFDFNPPIVTDVCTTQFVSTLANSDFDTSKLSVFPNPVQTNVTITNASIIDSVQFLSVLGQEVFFKKVNALQTEINTENLTKGVYFVKVIAVGKEKIIKIVKE